jgi:hypothetical protein
MFMNHDENNDTTKDEVSSIWRKQLVINSGIILVLAYVLNLPISSAAFVSAISGVVNILLFYAEKSYFSKNSDIAHELGGQKIVKMELTKRLQSASVWFSLTILFSVVDYFHLVEFFHKHFIGDK